MQNEMAQRPDQNCPVDQTAEHSMANRTVHSYSDHYIAATQLNSVAEENQHCSHFAVVLDQESMSRTAPAMPCIVAYLSRSAGRPGIAPAGHCPRDFPVPRLEIPVRRTNLVHSGRNRRAHCLGYLKHFRLARFSTQHPHHLNLAANLSMVGERFVYLILGEIKNPFDAISLCGPGGRRFPGQDSGDWEPHFDAFLPNFRRRKTLSTTSKCDTKAFLKRVIMFSEK